MLAVTEVSNHHRRRHRHVLVSRVLNQNCSELPAVESGRSNILQLLVISLESLLSDVRVSNASSRVTECSSQ